MRKQFRIPGKGDNETLEIVIPLEETWAAVDAVDGHVPENGGTCNDILCNDVRLLQRVAY
jgi:hypothetical protein